jgi:hypothetical protein
MPDNRTAADAQPLVTDRAAREAVREAPQDDDADQFPVSRLSGADSIALVGYPPHVVAGALAGVNRSKMTLDEAKAAVSAWLGSPVKTDPGLEG